MSYSKPSPPREIPDKFVSSLDEFSPDKLSKIAKYAEELAEYKAREQRVAEKNENEFNASADDLPDGVPAKASITIKEINGNRYYYWQWRDGDKIKSKYKGPVNTDS